MNGTALKSQNQFFDASSGFAPVRVVDFDGDGRPDMLTRHADGRMRVYAFDGTNFTTFSDVDAQAGWSAVPLNE